MKKCWEKFFLVFAVFVVLTFIVGCSTPPTKEIDGAEKAVAEAKLKEADQYSNDIFVKAESSLKRAKDLVAVKNYKDAKAAAEEATAFAQQAVQAVPANKTKMKAEAEKLVLDVQSSMNALKSSAAMAIRKRAKIDQQEIQEAIGKLEIELVTAKEHLQAEKIRLAFDQLTQIQEQIESHNEALQAVLQPKKQ